MSVLIKIYNFLRTVWLVIGAFLYIFVYGSIVLLIGYLLGKEKGNI